MEFIVSRTICNRAVVSTTSISGRPFVIDAVRDEDHIPSNVSFPSRDLSAIMPDIPLCVSMIRRVRF